MPRKGKSKNSNTGILIILLLMFSMAIAVSSIHLTIIPAGQFDNCDATTNTFGAWSYTIGGSGTGTLDVNTADKTEGTGSLDLSVSTGWDIYFSKRPPEPNNWDFSTNPTVTFKLKLTSINPNCRTSLYITTRTGNSSWESFEYSPFSLTEGVWTSLSVDLRSPAVMPPGVTTIDLTKVRQFMIYHGSATSQVNLPMHVLIDDIQTTGGSGPGPLTVSVSPTSKTIDKGQTATFTATASGGIGSYTYQWYEGTTPLTGKTSTSLTVTPANSGSYQYKVEVTSGTEVRSATATLFVNDPTQPSNTFTLIVNAEGNGTVTPEGTTSELTSETTITLTATPQPGYVFSKWTINNMDYTTNPINITVTSNTIATAYFIKETPGTTRPPTQTGTQPGTLPVDINYPTETLMIVGFGTAAIVSIIIYRRRKHS